MTRTIVQPRVRSIQAAILAVAIAVAPLMSGCGVETAVIAAAGVTAGFGLAQGQAESFINGELKAARMVPMETAWTATLAAAGELRVPILALRRGEYDAFVRVKAEGGPEITVQLKAKSPMITKFEVRV